MHALVSAVFLRRGGSDPLMQDAQPQPPDVEPPESVQTSGGEGHPVVGADGSRQPVLPEGPLEDRSGALGLEVRQSAAAQEIPGVLIADRQGEAPDAVPGRKRPLEVGGPQVVGRLGGRRHTPGCCRGRRRRRFFTNPSRASRLPASAWSSGSMAGCRRPRPKSGPRTCSGSWPTSDRPFSGSTRIPRRDQGQSLFPNRFLSRPKPRSRDRGPGAIAKNLTPATRSVAPPG